MAQHTVAIDKVGIDLLGKNCYHINGPAISELGRPLMTTGPPGPLMLS